MYHDTQKIEKCNNGTWHSADQSTIHEAFEDLRKIMRNNRKVCVRFICICAMSLRHPLARSRSFSLSLWCEAICLNLPITLLQVTVSHPGQAPSRRRRRAGFCYIPLSASAPPPPVTAHMRRFALVWMCKEDVEADPEWLTHCLLQYPLTTRASWQRRASHTWQTF